MIMEKTQENICCICGMEFVGYGHNPYPVKEKDAAAALCNYTVVAPERLNNFTNDKTTEKK